MRLERDSQEKTEGFIVVFEDRGAAWQSIQMVHVSFCKCIILRFKSS
jgi:hypothetical protein